VRGGACSRYDYEGVESEKAEKMMSTLRDIIADPSKVLAPFPLAVVLVAQAARNAMKACEVLADPGACCHVSCRPSAAMAP
jgi:hypothetical protein